jgi:hypothetical protein
MTSSSVFVSTFHVYNDNLVIGSTPPSNLVVIVLGELMSSTRKEVWRRGGSNDKVIIRDMEGGDEDGG